MKDGFAGARVDARRVLLDGGRCLEEGGTPAAAVLVGVVEGTWWLIERVGIEGLVLTEGMLAAELVRAWDGFGTEECLR